MAGPVRPPRWRRALYQPRPDMGETERVLRLIAWRRALARTLPWLFVLLVVAISSLLATPRRHEGGWRALLAKRPRAAEVPRTTLTSDGNLDLTIHDGEQQRTLRLERGKDGWRVLEYPHGPPSADTSPPASSLPLQGSSSPAGP